MGVRRRRPYGILRLPHGQTASVRPDLLLHPGSTIKADEQSDGTVVLEGLGIVFDEPGTENRDLTGEYFTADETHYGAAAKAGRITVDAPFHHHIPLDQTPEAKALADAILGEATMERTAKGWLATLVLPMREKYEEDIAQLAKDKKLGWSTGTAGHMYRAAADGMITRWPIVEVSPTPTPAEPRTSAGVKSIKEFLRADELRHRGETASRRAIAWSGSYNDLRRRIADAARDLFPNVDYVWVEDFDAESAIVAVSGDTWRIPLDVTDDGVTFGDRSAWTEVEPVTDWRPVAKGLADLNSLLAAPAGTPRQLADGLASLNSLFTGRAAA